MLFEATVNNICAIRPKILIVANAFGGRRAQWGRKNEPGKGCRAKFVNPAPGPGVNRLKREEGRRKETNLAAH